MSKGENMREINKLRTENKVKINELEATATETV